MTIVIVFVGIIVGITILITAGVFFLRRITIISSRKKLETCYDDAEQLNEIGVRLFNFDQLEDAKTALIRAASIAPSNPQIHINLGDVYRDLGEHLRAEQEYQMAYSIDPINRKVSDRLSEIDHVLLMKYKDAPFHFGRINRFNSSVMELFQWGVFPAKGLTLIDLRQAYEDLSTGIRDDVHNNLHKGEHVIDVVLTHGSENTDDVLRVKYVQRPINIIVDSDTGLLLNISGGKLLEYDCPPDGWVIPVDGFLWHPEIGVAIATVKDSDKALHALTRYIEHHSEKYSHWSIPLGRHMEFLKKYGKVNFDPTRPTPEQIAECELSYQLRPGLTSSGASAVWREFSRGPFEVKMHHTLKWGEYNVGVRERSRYAHLLPQILELGEGHPFAFCKNCGFSFSEKKAEIAIQTGDTLTCQQCSKSMAIGEKWDLCDLKRDLNDDHIFRFKLPILKGKTELMIYFSIMVRSIDSSKEVAIPHFRTVGVINGRISLEPIRIGITGRLVEVRKVSFATLGLNNGQTNEIEILFESPEGSKLDGLEIYFQ